MIRSFKCKETEKVFHRRFSKKFPAAIQRVILRKLRMLNRASDMNDLRIPPGNRLEALKGEREDQFSIRINNQWRICFEWENNDSYNVEVTDYH